LVIVTCLRFGILCVEILRYAQNDSGTVRKGFRLPERLKSVWLFFYFVATFEALHSAGGIDYLLLSGEEWMAFATQLHSERLLGGAGGEDVAAGANYLGICVIFGMYLRSHFTCSL